MKVNKIIFVIMTFLLSGEIVCGRGLFIKQSFPEECISFSYSQGYDIVNLKETFPISYIGNPELPVKVIYIAIPPDANVEEIKVISINKMVLEGEYSIIPTQAPESVTKKRQWTVPNPEVYSKDALYPGDVVRRSSEGYLAGHKIASILFYPLQYNPVKKKLILYRDIEIEVEYRSSIQKSVPVKRRIKEQEDTFKKMVKWLVENDADINMCSPTPIKNVKDDKFSPKDKPSLDGSNVDYVIITSEELASEFQALEECKIKKGVPIVVKTTSWLEENYSGCDRAEKIRNFIKDAYSNWGTVWVLLGGDADIIPIRFVHTKDILYGLQIATDYYYACIDGNWDGNRDGVFGEVEDSIDLYPDIIIGRASVKNVNDANTFVNKIIQYEKKVSLGYQTKMLFLGSNIFHEGDGKTYCDTVAKHIPDYFVKRKLYEVDGNESKEAVIDSIDSGFGLIFSETHGSFDAIDVQDGRLTLEDMDNLKNDNKFSIWYCVACLPASVNHDCIGEHFLLNPDGGGVAFIGSNTYDLASISLYYNTTFFDSLFQDDLANIGKILNFEKLAGIGLSDEYNSYRTILFGHTLLGDPEMPIWTEVPDSFVVTHPSSITIGPTNFTVTVKRWKWEYTRKGWIQVPVEDAKVCILKEDEDYAYGFTDADGEITFSFTPESVGEISVTVTKHNFIPYEDSCQVTYGANPYICYYSSQIDDDEAGSSQGNNNSKIEAGETIELSVTLKNTGVGTVYGVHATLSTSDTFTTIIDSTDYVSNISQGGTRTVDFLFQVSTNCPDDHDLTFDIEVNTESPGGTWHDQFILKVFAPSLIHAAHTLSPPVLDGWKEYTLPTTIRNIGLGDADNVTAILSCSDPIVVIIDSTESFGNIHSMEEVTCESSKFKFKIPLQEPLPSGKVFTLKINDGYNRQWVHNFDLQKPAPPSELSTMPYFTSIKLSWESSTATDIYGYNVYRGPTSEGPYTKLNEIPITGTTYYNDDTLSTATGYYYVATAVDSSRNESDYSSWIFEETNPQLLSGWPKYLANRNVSSPLVCNFDRSSPGYEVVVGSESLYVWHPDGTPVSGFPVYCGGSGTPSAGDIDDDGELEVISAPWSPENKLYAFNGDGTSVSGFPQVMDSLGEDASNCGVIGAPALGDIDNDGNLEIVIACVNGFIYAFNGDGTGVVYDDGFFAKRPGDSWSTASPAIGDVNGDDTLDIVVASNNGYVYAWYLSCLKVTNWVVKDLPGFPVDFSEPIPCDVAMGDIEDDGSLEITFATQNRNLFLLHSDGTIFDNWPKKLWFDTPTHTNMPSFSDIDGDGKLDVVVGDARGIWAFKDNGSPISDYPLYREKPINSQPVIGGSFIFVGSSDDRLYGYEKSGERLSGFPITMEHWVETSVALSDLDLDGDMDIVVTSLDGKVSCFNPGYANSEIEWGMYGHDIWHTGCYETDAIPPDPPQGLSGVWEYIGRDLADITLNWDPNSESDLAGYYVYRSDSSGGPFGYVGTAEPIEKPEYVDRVYAWKPYWYFVTAFDSVGNESGPSDTIKVEPEYYPGPCPFLFTWNGSEFTEDNNILTGSGPGEVLTDIYKLVQPLVETPPPMRYKLEIREEETEHSFFDMVSLRTLDHPDDVEIGINVEDEVVPIITAYTPRTAISGGEDYADVLSNDTSWFEGCEGDIMIVEFGVIEDVEDKELWMKSNKRGYPVSVEVEREDGWEYITSIFPRENFSTTAVAPLSEFTEDGDGFTIRLVWFADHNIKTIRIVQIEEVSIEDKKASLTSAIHSRLGNVKQALLNEDEQYADVLPGDTIRLEFAVTDQIPGWGRSFVFLSNGYYIIGDKAITFNNQDITPSIFALGRNHPNPFRNVTTIKYALPKEVKVCLKIYDIMGRLVMTLVDKNQKPGYYSISWDGRDLSTGVYFIRFEAGDFEKTRKALIIR